MSWGWWLCLLGVCLFVGWEILREPLVPREPELPWWLITEDPDDPDAWTVDEVLQTREEISSL